MSERKDYKFSITIFTEDLAVVNCLRALSMYSQKTDNNKIPWGGTKDKDWKQNRHAMTFRFSLPEYREGFVKEINRLLPRNLWREQNRNDNDPAKVIN